jgi:hypothetical protein
MKRLRLMPTRRSGLLSHCRNRWRGSTVLRTHTISRIGRKTTDNCRRYGHRKLMRISVRCSAYRILTRFGGIRSRARQPMRRPESGCRIRTLVGMCSGYLTSRSFIQVGLQKRGGGGSEFNPWRDGTKIPGDCLRTSCETSQMEGRPVLSVDLLPSLQRR